ncbi:EamA family transporter [Paenibacillus sp. VTT E-133280]|uniref:DMT family transporter n=1 Tax=Paenibacillus sp. VTT E-133280 TaxID=1986222 RepID=UPI000BA08FE7|nr:EamA family transporter [Paenibacillus sp. VTT E-133280]OZQ63323.1 EamA family transporter [Paenibacillus sp. VTT E-133280]
MNKGRGIFFIITGAVFWGIGGTVAKKLFQQYGIDMGWFVTIRLLIAGLLLLIVHILKKGATEIFEIWKDKKLSFQLLIFGLVGMLGVQYTYMASIESGNAAVATLLQYLAPVMIILYLLARKQSIPTRKDMYTVSLALLGCFFLLTNGSLSQLSVPSDAVVWGILSGIALAFYTLYAVRFLEKYDSVVIVGWAMLIGGVALSFVHPPWQMNIKGLPLEACLYLIFVIVFGTMLAFWFYIESLNSLSPKESSLLGSLEPLAAVLTTVFWLKEPLGWFQWIGTFCILAMILVLAFNRDTSSNR